MATHKTILDENIKIISLDYDFGYQKDLSTKLDNINVDFSQEIINEIVLWKVNRYALLKPETLRLINLIPPNSKQIDVEFTKNVLTELLNEKGIRLPMASTILRFRNKYIYQIIDQRVYRIIYPDKIYKDSSSINKQIEIYLQYLNDLRDVAIIKSIAFEEDDRIFYNVDKRINGDISLNNYGSNNTNNMEN